MTACLILLYAQPLARIIRLVADDICGNRQVYLRFGTPPAPAPKPFAAMLEEQVAAGTGTGWLFPAATPASPGAIGTSSGPCETPDCQSATRAHPRCATS
jgi:hypothetical protein